MAEQAQQSGFDPQIPYSTWSKLPPDNHVHAMVCGIQMQVYKNERNLKNEKQ